MVRNFAENEVEPLVREMDEKEAIPIDIINKSIKRGNEIIEGLDELKNYLNE